MSDDLIIDKINIVKSYGIRVSVYNLIGLPTETRDTIFDTIELNRKVKPNAFSINYMHPYNHTPIRKMYEDAGLSKDYRVTHNRGPHFIPKALSEEELLGLERTFPMYVRFPRDRFDEIKRAETDDVYFEKLSGNLKKLAQ